MVDNLRLFFGTLTNLLIACLQSSSWLVSGTESKNPSEIKFNVGSFI